MGKLTTGISYYIGMPVMVDKVLRRKEKWVPKEGQVKTWVVEEVPLFKAYVTGLRSKQNGTSHYDGETKYWSPTGDFIKAIMVTKSLRHNSIPIPEDGIAYVITHYQQ